jgi:hypothetical protein
MSHVSPTSFASNVLPLTVQQQDPLILLEELFELSLGITKETSLKIDKNMQELLEGLAKIIEVVSKNKVEEIKKELDAFVKKLEKQKKGSVLQKFLKALGVLALALAAVSTVVNPTPASAVLLALTFAMVLEPMISGAAGSKSVVESGMQKLIQALSDKIGTTAGAICSALLVCMLAFVLCSAATGLAARFAATAANSASKSVLTKLFDFLNVIRNDKNTLNNFHAIFNSAEAGVLLAQGVLQMELAKVRLDIAKYVQQGDLSRADFQLVEQIFQMLQEVLENKQSFRTEHRSSSTSLLLTK